MGGVRRRGTSERILVLNASPIIYLCKSGLAGNLKHLRPSFRFATTAEVYDEVYVRGIEKQVTEVGVVKDLFDDGVIEIMAPKADIKEKVNEQAHSSGIHLGETSVISLALELHATAIIDDKRARQVSRILNVKVSGTPAIVLEFVRFQVISKDEARRSIEKMVESGWYCSARAFSQIIRTIEEEA